MPVELDEICARALAPAKADRYETCDEMRMALQSWLAVAAPTTDGTRMSTFLAELFAEDIVRERDERKELISRVRTRALTMPPTDELRQMIESAGIHMDGGDGNDLAKPPVRTPGSIGRRATDRGDDGNDRRREQDRRGIRSSSPAIGGGAALAYDQSQSELEADLIGQQVDGRYRVLELIGEGGMGKVYLAEHVEIGKRVALKVLHQSYSRMPDLVERFRREARAASKIGHPNIVDVTDSGTTNDGSVYFVMEYLEGVELGSVIEREGAIDVARSLRITTQICRALSAAHREGIIHRDLKPENIFLITRDGSTDVVKVLDFGIAKTTEAEAARERKLTSPGMAMGTPEYMAPEQAAGRPADARTDVYALGAIMYEMVTGVPPYSGNNFMEILTKKATSDPPPPLTIRPELPSQVADLVMASMARNPDERPQTMEALEYELNKCLSGRGIAVAQILGMTTDANVVATLNPGLSMRVMDEGIVSMRTGMSAPGIGIPRAATYSSISSDLNGMASQPVTTASGSAPGIVPSPTTTGTFAAPRVSEAMPAVVARSSTPSMPVISEPLGDGLLEPRRSALGVLGWLMLAALLFGGVGALLYVALGERGESGTKTPPPVGSDVVEVQHPAVVPAAAPPDAAVPESGSATSPDQVVVEHPKTPDLKDSKKTPSVKTPTPPKPRPVAAVDDKDPKAIMKTAKEQEKASDWASSRASYKKLEKFPKLLPDAFYGQAWAAFNTDDVKSAMELSKKAIEAGHRTDAMFLYGDSLFRLEQYQRAKDVYTSLRKRLTGDPRAQAIHKIVACNQKLGVKDTDGTTD